MSKVGLVMTGGGARAANQVGVVRAIYEIVKKESKLFDIISATSAGAINSTYLAANCDDWDTATKNLWKALKFQKVFSFRRPRFSDLTLGTRINHLLDTSLLSDILEREIDFEMVKKNLDQELLHGINVIFYQGHESIDDWSRSDRFSYREDLRHEHLMASSALPYFLPPVKVGDSYFGDSCIRQTTPLSPAIQVKD